MQKKPRILIVEDEEAIRNGLEDVFVFHGYETETASTGPIGLQKALSRQFDLVLLDVMLPGMDGFSVLERIRAADREQAVILLTAKSADEDIIHGLALGADDYVAKPFSVTQLVLRVQAVLRRSRNDSGNGEMIRCADLEIDPRNLSAVRGEAVMQFTRREMDVVEYLHTHRERPVPREELLHKVWGYARDLDIETRTVDIHIAKLRRKIEPTPAEPRYLLTVRGAGYRLMSE
jgi:two-component system, OmpR family, response regulator RegX3